VAKCAATGAWGPPAADLRRRTRRLTTASAMERSLRNRLTYGPLMLAGLFLLLWLDYKAQQWTVGAYVYRGEQRGIAGLGILVLLLIAMPGAILELARLFAAEHVRPYRFIAAVGCGCL